MILQFAAAAFFLTSLAQVDADARAEHLCLLQSSIDLRSVHNVIGDDQDGVISQSSDDLNTGLALSESLGYYSEPDHLWKQRHERYLHQQLVQQLSMTTCANDTWPSQKPCMPACPEAWSKSRACKNSSWFQVHYEPTFSCDFMRRLGKQGEGGKWVCDPEKIPKKCLVYSVGSHNQYDFEQSIHDEVSSACEIHTVDMVPWRKPPPSFINFHVRKIGPLPDTPIPVLVAELGHQNRTIDIFKIDCEGCEWGTYKSWFKEGINIRQILVELHLPNVDIAGAHDFFKFLTDLGYVVFSKEPNLLDSGEDAEYAFLKLSTSFTNP